jgi:hypothetical protein
MVDYKRYDDLYETLKGSMPGIVRNEDSAGADKSNEPFAFNPNISRVGNLRRGAINFKNTLNSDFQKLPRGFIRNLATSQGDSLIKFPNIRCNFQFNPQDIQHQIEARKDMYLPILQDPSQLNQPMAGNASFAFELIFDRTMEVNSRNSVQDANGMPDVSSPETVGVFHDLRMLYSIIGQGLSQDLMEAQIAKIKNDIKAYAQRNYSELNIQYVAESQTFEPVKTSPDNEDSPIDPNSDATTQFLNSIGSDPSSDPSGITSFMSNLNVGNSAFLIPQPCRVVFSPMFMVDGFVMNTNVLFTKFSSTMIPIQCKVYLQMQAIYIGFARESTFITAQIAQTIEDNNTSSDDYGSEKNNLRDILAANIRSVSVSYTGDSRVLSGRASEGKIPTLDVFQTKGTSNSKGDFGYIYQPIWLYATKDFLYKRPYLVKGTPTPWVKPQSLDDGTLYDPTYRLDIDNPIDTPYGSPTFCVQVCPSKVEFESIKTKVFQDLDSSSPYVDIKTRMYVYGPYNTQTEATTFSKTISTTPGSKAPSDFIGSYSFGSRIENEDNWNDTAKDPLNWSIGADNWDSQYNSSNRASKAIGPSTKKTNGVSVFTQLRQNINLNADPLDTTQAFSLFYQTDKTNQENSNPEWDSNRTSSRYASTQLNSVPLDLYTYTPDSLLQLVNDVHGLSSKYFVVTTVVQVQYDLLGTDAQNTGYSEGLGIKVDVLKGSEVGYVANVDIVYKGARPLPV